MKAVETHEYHHDLHQQIGEPFITHPNDAVVRITSNGICKNYLQFIRRTEGRPSQQNSLDYEAIGIVELVGKEIRNLRVGDRVIVPADLVGSSCPCCQPNQHHRSTHQKHSYVLDFNDFKLRQGLRHVANYPFGYVRVPLADENLIKLADESPNK